LHANSLHDVSLPAPHPIVTDALVIGAGPVGLFQVFELGLREVAAQVVETLPFPGGQCVELYGDKPIYDIPALPVATGRELVDRLMQQLRPFAPGFHYEQLVSHLAPRGDGRFDVRTRAGLAFDCAAVVLAAGVGAFLPRSLKVHGLEAFEGRQLFHRGERVPDAALAARHVVVAGSNDEALRFALRLAAARRNGAVSAPASVTLLHRREVFEAEAATVAEFQAARAAGALRFIAGMPTGLRLEGAELAGLDCLLSDGTSLRVDLHTLVVLMGLSPKLGPLADWGVALERRQVSVDLQRFETSVPGIFAVGDVVHYPGKQRLILCGFHEATLAAAGVAGRLWPGADAPLEYTTSSQRLHRLLGV
jgi:thioredoxin reductase (NADPH)